MRSHFININILTRINAQVWIIDRTNPSKPLMKISRTDFELIKSGIYKSQNCSIKFNGKDLYITSNLFEQIKYQCKINKVNITNVRLSLKELIDLNNDNYEIDLSPIKHLKNSTDDIYLLLGKEFNDNNSKVVKNVTDELSKNGIPVKYVYNINDNFITDFDIDKYTYIVQKILIQHFTGIKINNDKFIRQDLEMYNDIHYYDNKQYTLNLIDTINKTLYDIVTLSSDNIRTIIIENIQTNNPILYVHKYSNNEVNNYETRSVRLEYITFFKKFEQFVKYKY